MISISVVSLLHTRVDGDLPCSCVAFRRRSHKTIFSRAAPHSSFLPWSSVSLTPWRQWFTFWKCVCEIRFVPLSQSTCFPVVFVRCPAGSGLDTLTGGSHSLPQSHTHTHTHISGWLFISVMPGFLSFFFFFFVKQRLMSLKWISFKLPSLLGAKQACFLSGEASLAAESKAAKCLSVGSPSCLIGSCSATRTLAAPRSRVRLHFRKLYYTSPVENECFADGLIFLVNFYLLEEL